ncbi:MAG: hypothetical protein RLZZ262_2393 [Bacteroidota bacterium]|jgi:hypothetical protein
MIKIQTLRILSLALFLSVVVNTIVSAQIKISDKTTFSILTCSPGADLYSLFGHTAIRVTDNHKDRFIDLVFNYGTFEFSDDFYVKFAMGKLNYQLSVSRFGDFQKSYIDEMRGIEEQVLLLNHAQKIHLWELLQCNYQPENQTYRYDFFYDNCSTRVRDIILLACQMAEQHPIADSLNVAPDLNYQATLRQAFPDNGDPSQRSSLQQGQPIAFTYTYPSDYSFRDAIDRYLVYQPWSDFGIDVALGLPCDRSVLHTQAMFLPDSLKKEFHYAHQNNQAVVTRADDLLFNENEFEQPRFFTPFWIFTAVFLFIASFSMRADKRFDVRIWDRLFLIVVGLIGLLVCFLWFITDHHATVNNLNILWAHPLWILFAFKKQFSHLLITGLKILAGMVAITLIVFPFLPQQLHVATIPLMLTTLLICFKILKTAQRAGSKQTSTVISA